MVLRHLMVIFSLLYKNTHINSPYRLFNDHLKLQMPLEYVYETIIQSTLLAIQHRTQFEKTLNYAIHQLIICNVRRNHVVERAETQVPCILLARQIVDGSVQCGCVYGAS